MDQQEIITFFDRQAPGWDGDLIRNEDAIRAILDNARVQPGIRVLDVACGTGVLFPDYQARGITDLTAIDISPEMVRIASGKFPHVQVICGDVEKAEFSGKFDLIMIYNAFPHFPDPKRLIRRMASLLNPGGRLCVAHGMSREALQAHHAGHAAHVSLELPPAGSLAELFFPLFQVDVVISDDTMYQVSGILK